MRTLNTVMRLGTIPDDPKLVYGEHGTPQCRVTPLVEEKGQEHPFRRYVPVDVFDGRAEKVAEAVRASDTSWSMTHSAGIRGLTRSEKGRANSAFGPGSCKYPILEGFSAVACARAHAKEYATHGESTGFSTFASC
jgi:hypothetical protein